MTITLVGSSRELKNRRILPPIDLLNLLAGDTPVGGVARDDAAPSAKPKWSSSSTLDNNTLSSRKVRSTGHHMCVLAVVEVPPEARVE